MMMVMALGIAGCDGDDDGPAPDARCFDYASFEELPGMSLREDVMPIFQSSCTFGNSCHGVETGAAGKVYLGPSVGVSPSDMQLQVVLDQTVGKDPVINAGMPLITAGDASQSFLMHKADGSLECPELACVEDESCGLSMPYGQDLLDPASRNKVRSWILQGAGLN